MESPSTPYDTTDTTGSINMLSDELTGILDDLAAQCPAASVLVTAINGYASHSNDDSFEAMCGSVEDMIAHTQGIHPVTETHPLYKLLSFLFVEAVCDGTFALQRLLSESARYIASGHQGTFIEWHDSCKAAAQS